MAISEQAKAKAKTRKTFYNNIGCTGVIEMNSSINSVKTNKKLNWILDFLKKTSDSEMQYFNSALLNKTYRIYCQNEYDKTHKNFYDKNSYKTAWTLDVSLVQRAITIFYIVEHVLFTMKENSDGTYSIKRMNYVENLCTLKEKKSN